MAPRVTALVADPRDRVRVELDGRPWRTLPGAAVVAASIRVGTELDRERARTLRRALRRAEALAAAAAILARRDHSAAGLQAKLGRRRLAPGEGARAVEQLAEAGYVDDARFACDRAALLADRGYGDAAIRHDLERHGVGVTDAETALAALPGEQERARAYVAQAGVGARTARRLAARGFAVESVETALGSADADDD